MKETFPNPFNITKAVDLSDQEINDYWVDIRGSDGFLQMVKPTSPMPMYILGGKGSGKTHLMRYLSYSLQKLRHKINIVQGIKEEGYLGIYFRCAGLNASRFNAKGQSEETWAAIFAYFMELWFAQIVIQIVVDAFSKTEELIENEIPIIDNIRSLFDNPNFETPQTLSEFVSLLGDLQKQVNIAVNNCVITRKLDINILVTSGKLIFGVPQVLANTLHSLRETQFLYLVDEFENLADPQQTYFNTLLREKENPCSFKIGARLYGIKTHNTLSAGENNIEGSEFETIYLDSILRRQKEEYRRFAKQMCTRRLIEAGYRQSEFDSFFDTFKETKFAEDQTQYALSKLSDANNERPYFRKLRKYLERGISSNVAPGVNSNDDINLIINNLTKPAYPVLEKTNTFLFYQDWYNDNQLIQASEIIAKLCEEFVEKPYIKSRYQEVFSHYKADLLAQLLRDCKQKQMYIGFDTFVDMSDGLPRNLLIILKHIFKWSLFNGERPFRSRAISKESQQKGVKEASEWFYRDARIPGREGEIVRDGIDRLATLLREIRFSDKPAECSLSTFSTDISQVSKVAESAIELAEKWSLLICISGGQRDRNSMRIDVKYQLNGMLAPHWDLPISRRGTLSLNSDDINSIFDPQCVKDFEAIKDERVQRMKAPFFGKRKNNRKEGSITKEKLPLFDND